MHEVFDDHVEVIGQANLVILLDHLLVFSDGELFDFIRILDDFNESLLLREVVNFALLIWHHAVANNLVNIVILLEVNPGLVKDVELILLWSLVVRDVDFGLGKTRNEAELLEDLLLVDFVSRQKRLTKSFQFLDVLLSFSGAKSTEELQLVMHVLMVD